MVSKSSGGFQLYSFAFLHGSEMELTKFKKLLEESANYLHKRNGVRLYSTYAIMVRNSTFLRYEHSSNCCNKHPLREEFKLSDEEFEEILDGFRYYEGFNDLRFCFHLLRWAQGGMFNFNRHQVFIRHAISVLELIYGNEMMPHVEELILHVRSLMRDKEECQ